MQSLVLAVPLEFALQHLMPASAGWTNSNSSAAKATTATVNFKSNPMNHDGLFDNP
jgi:hypothetical protein